MACGFVGDKLLCNRRNHSIGSRREAESRPRESTGRHLATTLRGMLSKFDDFPIHQTPEPVAHPATSDKDVYERYWFNGYSTSGDFYLGAGAALYQHLGVKDAHVSFIHEGRQYAFHVSGRRPDEPSDLTIGPYSLEIIEPMRSCRIRVTENETDFTCDLLWEGRTGNVEEPRHHLGRGLRKIMDTTRFTQLGRWTGWVQFGDVRIQLDPAEIVGTKDRSWGVRPLIGGDTRGAPAASATGGIFFLWAPLNFEDLCLHYQLFDDTVGRPLFQVGARLPVYGSLGELPGVEDPAVEHMRNLEHDVTFASGSRMITAATIAMTSVEDENIHVLGDSSRQGAMPKSGFSANSQAKVVAMAVRHALTGSRLFPARFSNTCWSLIDTDDGIKVGATYEAGEDRIEAVDHHPRWPRQ